jgi:outer membrane protein assembly factor BamB
MMTKRFTRILSLIVGLAWTATLYAADNWPQWRGPNRDGCSTDANLLKAWPEEGPRLLWKATGIGIGYADVSVAGGRIFTMGDLDDASQLIALNETDGNLLWKTKVGKAGATGYGSFEGPRASPSVDGNLVFAIGQFGEVLCADTATGREIWRKHLIDDFGGVLPEWAYSGSPLVDGNQVILAPGGKQGDLVALDKKTGKLIWQSTELTDSIHYASPIVVEIGGVRQYIQLTGNSLAGLATADGRLLWRIPRDGKEDGTAAVVPTPIYHDGFVYATSAYGVGCNLYKITATGGKFSAEQVYANRNMMNHHGGVVLVGDHIYGYGDSKGWLCQDLVTGKIVWQDKKLGKGSISYADGMLYLRAEVEKGTVALIEATPEGYRETGRFDPPDRSDKSSWPHPVIAGGRLYLRDQDVLLCYDVRAK